MKIKWKWDEIFEMSDEELSSGIGTEVRKDCKC